MATSGTITSLYMLSSPEGKSYIGITSAKVAHRWQEHLRAAIKGSKLAIHAAIRKYGWESVERKVVAIGEFEYIKELEQKAISAFETKSPDGYNLTDGGDGTLGAYHSDEARKKNSEAVKAVWKRPGYRERQRQMKIDLWKSPDHRAQQVASHTGRIATAEQRDRMSKSQKALGRTVSEQQRAALSKRMMGNTLCRGKRLTQEHKDKVSAAQIGKTLLPSHVEKLKAACAERKTLKCPHCCKESTSAAMYHWHFDNCKKRMP